MSQEELISEPITPFEGSFNTSAMGRGEPGLPQGFTWRDESFEIVETISSWKQSSREGGAGDLYLRRHYYRLRLKDSKPRGRDDVVWTVYFIRQTPKTGNAKQRWFLYTIERNRDDNETTSGEGDSD